jgi:DNA-binding XRE family transcriptional regulator
LDNYCPRIYHNTYADMSKRVKFEQHDPETTLRIIDMLRERREEIGLSRAMLASIAGVDESHIGKIERFERKEMSIKTFFLLLNSLNIEVQFIKKEEM